MHEAVLEDLLLQHRCPLGGAHQRHHLGLKVRREAGKGLCRDVHGPGAAVAARHRQAAVGFADVDLRLFELFAEGAQQLTPPADHLDLAAADRGGQHVGAQLDPVGDHRMRRPAQPVDALDRDLVRSFALDLRAHAAQAAGKVHDLGLARGVLEHGGALGQRRGHQRVLGRAHRNEREVDDPAFQPPGRLGVHVAVAQVHLGPQRFHRAQVQIHRPRADRAAAGQGDEGVPVARQHRPQHEDRGAHLAHDVVIGAVIVQRVTRKRQNLAVLQRHDLGPERPQKLAHRRDIAQARGIRQRQRLFRQKRRRHQSKAGVLCARDWDAAPKRSVTAHHDSIHPRSPCSCRVSPPRRLSRRVSGPWPAPCAARGSP